jgi:hypothetical protein
MKEKHMSSNLIVSRFDGLASRFRPPSTQDLHSLYLFPERLPKALRNSAEAMRCLNLLGPLAWDRFPERDLRRNYGQPSTPYTALTAACLLKLELGIGSYSRLVSWLAENASIAWLLGFHSRPIGFNPAWRIKVAGLPDQHHFSRLLHKAPNQCFQFLLSSSVQVLLAEFARRDIAVPDTISLDTKHILLGCKRQHNKRKKQPIIQNAPATPTTKPQSAEFIKVGEFYWGYGSGIVVTKVPGWGELVLAELTQTFDHADLSYFFPLMSKTEHVLGFKPRIGTFDAAFDAWYVYDYFYSPADPGAFATVPFSEKGGFKAHERLLARMGFPCARPTCPCLYILPTWTPPSASSNTSAASMSVRSAFPKRPPKPAPSTIRTGPRKAVPP